MRVNVRVWAGVIAWALLAVVCVPTVRADDADSPLSSVSPAPTTQAPAEHPSSGQPPVLPGHAWFMLREQLQQRDKNEIIKGPLTTRVFHLPPRGVPGSGLGGTGGAGRAGDGVIRSAPGFEGVVDAAAWVENRAYFLLKETIRSDGGRQRQVAMFRVLRNALGGFDHLPGHPEALSPLIGDLDVLGWGATEDGPVVLARERLRVGGGGSGGGGAAAAGERRSFGPIHLRVLFGPEWRTVALDPGCADALADLRGPARRSVALSGAREGLTLWVRSADGASSTAWTGRVGKARDRGFGPPDLVQWSPTTFPLTGPNWPENPGQPDPARPERVVFVQGDRPADDALIGVQRDGRDLRFVLLRPSGPIPLARLEGVPEDASVLPMAAPGVGGGGGGVAVVWAERASDAPADALNPRRDIQMREVSALTGRVLYSGPARDSMLLSGHDFKLLAAMLVMVMVAVILFVLRAEPGGAPGLPDGLELADPIRRVAAALLDYAPGALCAALVMGLPALTLLRPTSLIGPGLNLLPLGLALLFAAVHCTIGEWLMGASLGKRLMGLHVIRLGTGDPTALPEHPALWQALVRNLTRWLVPLLAIVALFDAGRRHPGDMLGRTIVVMDAEPEAGDGAE